MKEKEKKYGLLKAILLFILIGIILSWLIPTGEYVGTYQGDGTLIRIGITDLYWLANYGFYFGLDKILLLLAVGGLYGILSKIECYERLVNNVASKLSKNSKVAVVCLSIIIAVLTSLLTQSFAIVIFIPFIVSILKRMKLDKMTILATTFGSILVGTIGATYGTEGLYFFKDYLSAESFNPNKTVLLRGGILLIGLVLFNFFTLSHMSRKDKDNETSEIFPIEIEENKKAKKRSFLPIVILGIITLIICILGFTNWSNWSIFANADETGTIFQDFHSTLYEIHIGKNFYPFKSILGVNLKAFGLWDLLFPIVSILILFTIIIGICYRFKLDDFIKNYAEGAKKMIKPCLVVAGAFALMALVYMSPYIATIANKFLTMSDDFNLAGMSITALIANIFHTDLGFTGYIIGSHLASNYTDYLNIIFVIFVSLYGFVQLFIPTSVILGVGLTSLDVKYKDWLKYIWKFIIGMLICLLVIFILKTLS